jgi:hypothetical protein
MRERFPVPVRCDEFCKLCVNYGCTNSSTAPPPVTFIKAVGEGFGVSNLYSKSGMWKKPSSFLAKPSMDAVGFGSLTRRHFAEMLAFFLLQIKQSRSALQQSAKCPLHLHLKQ